MILDELRALGIRVDNPYLPRLVPISERLRTIPPPERQVEWDYPIQFPFPLNVARIIDRANEISLELASGLAIHTKYVDDQNIIQALERFNCGYTELEDDTSDEPCVTQLYIRGDDRQLYQICAAQSETSHAGNSLQGTMLWEILTSSSAPENTERLTDGPSALYGCLIKGFDGWHEMPGIYLPETWITQ